MRFSSIRAETVPGATWTRGAPWGHSSMRSTPRPRSASHATASAIRLSSPSTSTITQPPSSSMFARRMFVTSPNSVASLCRIGSDARCPGNVRWSRAVPTADSGTAGGGGGPGIRGGPGWLRGLAGEGGPRGTRRRPAEEGRFDFLPYRPDLEVHVAAAARHGRGLLLLGLLGHDRLGG